MTFQNRHSFFLVLLIWLAGLTAAGQFSKIAIPFASVEALYPDSSDQVGWLLTLVSGLGAIFGMTAGVFVTRIGVTRTLVGALVLGAACSLYQASEPSFTAMLLSRFVEGISHLAIVVAAPTLIAQITPVAARGMALSFWSTFFGVTFALTAWLGPDLVAAYGVTRLFAVHGGMMLVLAPLLALLLPRIVLEAEAAPLSVLRRHWEAYRSPSISAPASGWLFYAMTFVALLVVLPGLMDEEHRVLTVTLMPIASIVMSLGLVPLCLMRLTAVQTVVLGYALSAGIVFGILLGLPLEVSAVLLFGTLGFVQGASFAAVPQLCESFEARALANGAIAQMGNIGNLIGTPIFLAVLSVGGQFGVLMTVLIFYGLSIAGHIGLASLRAKAR